MLKRTALIVVLAAVRGIASVQPTTDSQGEPSFTDYPVVLRYTGPIATVKFKNGSDKERLGGVLSTMTPEPNFAGKYRIVQFKMGEGPMGVVLVDARSGAVFRLPGEIVGRDLYIAHTDCLATIRRWQHPAPGEVDHSMPLSFTSTSELLIIRQCILVRASVVGVRRDYYRWHGRRCI